MRQTQDGLTYCFADRRKITMDDPRKVGRDAQSSTSALLKQYDLEIARKFTDNAILPMVIGSKSVNADGKLSYVFKTAFKVDPPSDSVYGDENNVAKFQYTETEVNYLSLNQELMLKEHEILEAEASGYSVDQETVRALAASIYEKLDYNLYNGVDSPKALTGLIEHGSVNDAGAPTGVWDTSAMYTDILAIIGTSRANGWDGALNMLATPYLAKNFSQFVTDGTTTFPVNYFDWTKGLLNGGNIFFSSHFATAATSPSQSDKVTASGATNQVIVCPPNGVSAQVIYGSPLRGLEKPAQQGDLYRNYKLKYTLAIKNPQWITFMDGIDPTT
jgi:hypothetical protein